MTATLEADEASNNARAPQVVLFDFDGTLVHGDAFTLFIRARYRHAWWRLLPILLVAPVLVPMSLLRRGRRAIGRVLVRVALFGTPEPRYRALAEQFGRALGRNSRLFSRMGITALRQHVREGNRVLVATACEETLARAIFDELGLGRIELVASRIEQTRWRTRVRVHNIGAEKLRQLAARGVNPPWEVAISDSLADLPMLAAAREAILVNPKRRMLKRASAKLGDKLRAVEWD